MVFNSSYRKREFEGNAQMKTIKRCFTTVLAVCLLICTNHPVKAESTEPQDSFLLRVWNQTDLEISYLRFDYFLGDAQQGYVLCCPNEGEDFYRFEVSKEGLYSLETGNELNDFRAECSYCISELSPEDAILSAMMGTDMGEIWFQTLEIKPVFGEEYDYLFTEDGEGGYLIRPAEDGSDEDNLGISFFGNIRAEGSTADPAAEPTTVLLFGDSNTFGYMPVAFETHGYRYPYEVRWTTKVSQSLGADYNVVIDGLMGRTIDKEHAFYGDYERGTYALPSTFIGNYPIDIMVVMLGTNDCTVEQNMTAEEIAGEMRNFLDDTIELANGYQDGFVPRIILVAPPLIRPEWKDSVSNLEGAFEGWEEWQELDDAAVEKSAALAGLYEQIAADYGCTFVDAGVCEVSEEDCIHLTADGHTQLAELITDAIKGISLDQEWLDYRADMIGAGRF